MSEAKEFRIFCLGAMEFGIDTLRVQEICAYKQLYHIADVPAFIRGEVNLGGVMVPIVDLRLRLGCDSAEYNQLTMVIVLNVRGRVIGVVVDSVSDVLRLQSSQIRPVTQFSGLDRDRFIKYLGITDDRLIRIMDIEAVLGGPEMGLFPPK